MSTPCRMRRGYRTIVVALTMRIGMSAVACITTTSVMPGWLQAQVRGDIGTPECRRYQRSMQGEVAQGKVVPYQMLGDRINATAGLVTSAVAAGAITNACANCILQQMFSGVPIKNQVSCGGPPTTPTPTAGRKRSRVPTPK